jgi:hypothetical protein
MKTFRILASAGLLASGLVIASGLATSASASTVKNCTPGHLKTSIGTPEGTAGTIYYPIVFTNEGPACAIWGVPAVQTVRGGAAHSHLKVGPLARNNSIGEMPVRHVIATGHEVSAGLGVGETGNYTPSTCGPKNAGAIVVSLGSFVPHSYLTLKISVCTKLASVSTRLIVAGATGA